VLNFVHQYCTTRLLEWTTRPRGHKDSFRPWSLDCSTMWAPNFGPSTNFYICINCVSWSTHAVSVALTVPQKHRVQSADRLPNGHELSVLHSQSPPSQLSCWFCRCWWLSVYSVSQIYTDSIMGCSLAAVADMSHLHSARKKNTLVWSMTSR